jgi:hypothetical protein
VVAHSSVRAVRRSGVKVWACSTVLGGAETCKKLLPPNVRPLRLEEKHRGPDRAGSTGRQLSGMVPRNDDQLRRPPHHPRLLSIQSLASKHSFRSHSSSFEADDEFSSTTSTDSVIGRMSPRGSIEDDGQSGAHYPGEDTRPTSKKELAGWYMYAFAAETYVICGKLPSQRLRSRTTTHH